MNRLAVLLLPAVVFATTAANELSAQRAAATGLTSATFARLPISFEANQGQANASVDYLGRGQGYSIALDAGGASFQLQAKAAGAKAGSYSTVALRLAGANSQAVATHEDPLITRTNYILGRDPAKWHTGIPNYGRVRYSSVYDGIDLVYYGNQQQLEHDFIVRPHADPDSIRLALEGTNQLHLDPATGDLILTSQGQSNLRLLKPVSYQQSHGQRTEVTSAYKLLAHNQVSFTIGAYDHTQPLIIDPIVVYSTYLGGSGQPDNVGDEGHGILVDAAGHTYVVGATSSPDFPVTSGIYQPANHALATYPYRNAFVSEINAAGTQLIFSTYFGGSDTSLENDTYSGDYAMSVALDSSGNVYLCGYTFSDDFPTTPGAFQTVNYHQIAGASRGSTAFVAKFNATGTTLEYSTYLGGHGALYTGSAEIAVAIAVDAGDNAYVTGATASADYPTTPGAFQTASAAQRNAFVTKVNPTGTALVYSTLLGSPKTSTDPWDSSSVGLALDSLGDVYVAGTTSARDFPVTAKAYLTTNPTFEESGTFPNTSFVTKINPSGSGLVYSTYFGGDGNDSIQALAIDSSGSAYVAGTTFSFDFPLQGGLMVPWYGNGFGFLTKFDPTGKSLVYSTLIGDSAKVSSLAVDSTGEAFVFGSVNPLYFQITPDGTNLQKQVFPGTLYFSKVNAAGNALKFATLFGGSDYDLPGAVAVDGSGDAIFTGTTSSNDFPTTSGSLQTTDNGLGNYASQAFITKLGLAGETSDHFVTQMALAVSSASVKQGTLGTITITTTSGAAKAATGNVILAAAANSPMPFAAQNVALNASGIATFYTSTMAPGSYILYATYPGDTAHTSANSATMVNGTVALQVVSGPASVIWGLLNYVLYGQSSSGYSFGVIVNDSLGDPVPGVSVTFSANSSSVVFSPITAATDASGSAPTVVQSNKGGSFIIYATVAGIKTPFSHPVVVTPAPITVTVFNRDRTYGAVNPVFSSGVKGLIGTDTVTVTGMTTATKTSPIGKYPITATISGPDAVDYVATVIPGVLDVLPATLTVMPSPGVRSTTYGHAIPTFTGFTLTGLLNGDTASVVTGAPILSTTATPASPFGTYPLNIAQGTLSATNYNFKMAPGKLNVVKALLTATPGSFTIKVGDPLPAFTYTLSGFFNGDTAAVVNGTPVLGTTAPNTLKPGRWYTTGTNGSLASTNYNFTWTTGVLTITR